MTASEPAPQSPNEHNQKSAAATVESHLTDRLRDILARYFVYPSMARRNGWEGKVQVGLRVEADGRLSHLHIAHSSGYPLLDDSALTTLNRIDTLPEAAGWLDGQHFDMVLPIEYRLIDGQS
jgi:TonB family protein